MRINRLYTLADKLFTSCQSSIRYVCLCCNSCADIQSFVTIRVHGKNRIANDKIFIDCLRVLPLIVLLYLPTIRYGKLRNAVICLSVCLSVHGPIVLSTLLQFFEVCTMETCIKRLNEVHDRSHRHRQMAFDRDSRSP